MTTCPSCGAENREGARFCDTCGVTLGAAAPLREERKVVSILFTDLVGFTSRAEQLDPEDVRATLSPTLERSASLRCHDCRDAAAPIRPDLVARMPGLLKRWPRLRRAA